jgi:hypothetical protein
VFNLGPHLGFTAVGGLVGVTRVYW